MDSLVLPRKKWKLCFAANQRKRQQTIKNFRNKKNLQDEDFSTPPTAPPSSASQAPVPLWVLLVTASISDECQKAKVSTASAAYNVCADCSTANGFWFHKSKVSCAPRRTWFMPAAGAESRFGVQDSGCRMQFSVEDRRRHARAPRLTVKTSAQGENEQEN